MFLRSQQQTVNEMLDNTQINEFFLRTIRGHTGTTLQQSVNHAAETSPIYPQRATSWTEELAPLGAGSHALLIPHLVNDIVKSKRMVPGPVDGGMPRSWSSADHIFFWGGFKELCK